MPKLLIVALAAPIAMSAAQPEPMVCTKPVPVPSRIIATNPTATYYSSDEPPARFAHAPTKPFSTTYGDAEIARLCGRPPCGMRFLGCTRGNEMALPDPFKTDPVTFAHVARHEFAHAAGWPASHGA